MYKMAIQMIKHTKSELLKVYTHGFSIATHYYYYCNSTYRKKGYISFVEKVYLTPYLRSENDSSTA